MIGARTVGAAERALSLALDWAKTREQGDNALIEYQLIQAMLADSAVDIAANRALVHQVAWEFTQGASRKTLHAKAAMVKLSASEAAGRVVDRAVQIFGGRGYMRDYPVERLYRELRVDRIWEGTSEVQRLVIANELNKRGTDQLLALPGSGPQRCERGSRRRTTRRAGRRRHARPAGEAQRTIDAPRERALRRDPQGPGRPPRAPWSSPGVARSSRPVPTPGSWRR